MIGRMCGAVSAFNLSDRKKLLYKILIPLAGFLLVILVNVLKKNDYRDFLVYIPCIATMIAAMIFGQGKPFRTLLIFSAIGVLAMCIGLLTEGKIAVYAFISGGLWCSVLWPCIVPSALAGLGKYVNQGMTFIIMSVLGAALIPYLQGRLADKPSVGIHLSYIIPAICFAYLIFYALIVKRILKKKGLDFDAMQSGGH
jgi:FHS family L-fucose permease-like MFS transporter